MTETADEKWNQSLKFVYGIALSTQLVPVQNAVQVAIWAHHPSTTSPDLKDESQNYVVPSVKYTMTYSGQMFVFVD